MKQFSVQGKSSRLTECMIHTDMKMKIKTSGKGWHTHWNHVLVLWPTDCIECTRWPGKNWGSCMSRIFSHLQTEASFMFCTNIQDGLNQHTRSNSSKYLTTSIKYQLIRTDASWGADTGFSKSLLSWLNSGEGLGHLCPWAGLGQRPFTKWYRASSICVQLLGL